MKTVYIQTCQQCGHKNVTKPPNLNDEKEKWRERRCRKCKDQSLDFGSWQDIPENETDKQELKRRMEED